MTAAERPRLDILVGGLRGIANSHTIAEYLSPVDIATIVAAADDLEARIQSPHIDAKHYAEVCRLRVENGKLRNEVARLSEQSQSEPEYVGELRAEVESLRRLHEVATQRTVQLAAVIARVKELRAEGGFVEVFELDRLLESADTGAVLAERDAEKFDEGARGLALSFPEPVVNPYPREEPKR